MIFFHWQRIQNRSSSIRSSAFPHGVFPHGVIGLRLLVSAMGLILVVGEARMQAAEPSGASQNRGVAATVDAQRQALISGWQDDAPLQAVQAAGSQVAYAVGEHGVIWRTRNGGESWDRLSTGVTAALHGVSVLTDRVLFAAGGSYLPFTGESNGCLLRSNDGGETWTELLGPPEAETIRKPSRGVGAEKKAAGDRAASKGAATQTATAESQTTPSRKPHLPCLRGVRFFSPEIGIVWGEPGPQGSGVWRTEDGGLSWQPFSGSTALGWDAAAFRAPDAGVLLNHAGETQLLSGAELRNTRLRPLVGRRLHHSVLLGDDSGWLVGDGGLILQTTNRGLVWQSPATDLPQSTRDLFDFQAVSAIGSDVWVAGSPGTVIWHSPDRGQTWERQLTRQTLPLHSLSMGSAQVGYAVGALGLILRTADGGRTWESVRGEGRRVAILNWAVQPDQASLPLTAISAGEQGYRTHVSVLVQPAVAREREQAHWTDRKLQAAVALLGGHSAEISARFPMDLPELNRDLNRLWERWDQVLEGRAESLLRTELTRSIRTWRPSVIVFGEMQRSDALSQAIYQAVVSAIADAGDGTRALVLQETADLRPWKVDRLLTRLPLGDRGDVQLDLHQYLPRQHSTPARLVTLADGLSRSQVPLQSVSESLHWVRDIESSERSKVTAISDPFTGLFLSPGGDARRDLLPVSAEGLEDQMRLARQQRTVQAYLDRMTGNPRGAAVLVAEASNMTRGLDDSSAALQLGAIVETLRDQGQYELAESVAMELIDRFPREAVAQREMAWLIQQFGSGEMIWKRVRPSSEEHVVRGRGNLQSTLDAVSQAEAIQDAQAQGGSSLAGEAISRGTANQSLKLTAGETVVSRSSLQRRDVAARFRIWQDKALAMKQRLEQYAPAIAQQPETQLALAGIYRSQGRPAQGNELLMRLIQRTTNDAWGQAAAGELWLVRPEAVPPRPVLACSPASSRPHLDGLLSDSCWQQAEEIVLTNSLRGGANDPRQHTLAMLSYDSEFLYFSASCPRAERVAQPKPAAKTRSYDTDLTGADRISLHLDIDRDYGIAYHVSIDEQGRTADRCGEDTSWNPKYFVAVQPDPDFWRVEMAIPLEELLPGGVQPLATWNIAVVLIQPAIALETAPAKADPLQAVSYGLMTFSE